MAHFARIVNNIVTQVIVVGNGDIIDNNGIEQESIGKAYCTNLLGGEWVQTSYNNKFRHKYAGIGDTYDAIRDVFIEPQPYPSWTFNEQTLSYIPPVSRPSGMNWIWDENTTKWVENNAS